MQVQEAEAAEAVTAYSFEDMLDRKVEEQGVDFAFHIHVPKAGGGTVALLFQQNDFQIIHFDMASGEFFETVADERRVLDGYRAPAPRPHSHLLTGHFRLDHPIFRRIGVPHFTVTTLRDPVSRMVSNYNHSLLVPGNLRHEEVVSGRMPFIEHAAKSYAAVGPQYSFFDDTGRGTFAPTGRATPQECLHNLLTKVTFYGLTDRLDEFVLLFGCLAGRHRILGMRRANVTMRIENPKGLAPKKTLTASERDGLSDLLKEDIWFYQEAVKEYDRRLADPRFDVIFRRVLPIIRHYDPIEAENRKLRLGGGATFEELEAAGKAGGGRVYRFDDLISLSPTSAAPAPPLVFINVPKTDGAIVNQVLMKNFRYRLDSYGNALFPRYFPDEFVSLVRAPLPNDTRRPIFHGSDRHGKRRVPLHAGSICGHHPASRSDRADHLALPRLRGFALVGPQGRQIHGPGFRPPPLPELFAPT
jgi:hypothetical protein